MTPEGLQFPTAVESRTFVLDSATVAVGRRREADGRGSETDRGCPIDDPGVSRLHAVLLRRTDGSYSVVDAGSTNGTRLNGASLPIAVDTPVALADGDHIHVGAWTTITIHLC
jgi:pSer/pThr/pTyr-binding forkhead associated (FHA) protein